MTNDISGNKPSVDAVTMMRYDANKKSVGVAYLLWFFLGIFGVHRFYLHKNTSGIVILISSITGSFLVIPLIITIVFLVIDLFTIPTVVKQINLDIASESRS